MRHMQICLKYSLLLDKPSLNVCNKFNIIGTKISQTFTDVNMLCVKVLKIKIANECQLIEFSC